jgi:hypothetical protein
MEEELTLDFIEDLLKEPDPTVKSKPTYQVPEQTSTYVRSVDKVDRCIYNGCGAPTYTLIKDKPYCTIHAIYYMGDLLDEKINHYPGISPGTEQIMKTYERMESHPPVDFREEWLNMNAKSIVIERPDHQTLKIIIEGKEYSKSPYVDIEGILILSFLKSLR